jgi:putative inorganic carbon (hco3(-)) transporter
MLNRLNSFSLSGLSSRPDLLAALLGGFGFIALLFIFQTPWVIPAFVLVVVGCFIFWVGYDYIPLILFLQLAFSVELQITSSTRLTVPTELLIPILFLMFGFSVLFRGKITYRSSPLNVAIIILYCVMVASLRHTLEPISTIKAIIRDTGYIVAGYYLIPRYIRTEKHLWQLIYGCFGIHTLLVLYGFATQAMGGFHVYGDIAKPFFIEHCIYAAYITITFSFLLAFYLDMEPSQSRFWMGIVTALFGAAILLTFVRAAWISIVFLLVYYLFLFRRRKSSVDLLIVLIVVFLLGMVVAATTDIGSLILKRLDSITETKYSANLDRIDRWTVAWRIWGDHPYLGTGWGSYPDVYFSYSSYAPDKYDPLFVSAPFASGFRMGAHNIYLELMAEVGLVGLFAYLAMIYTFFHCATFLHLKLKDRRQRTLIIGVQGAMITYLVHAFVNNLGPSDKMGITFWFLMGMVPTLDALHRSSEKERQVIAPKSLPDIVLEMRESD